MKRTKIFIALVILIIALVVLGWEMLKHPGLKYTLSAPSSYAQCVDAGGMILESYPSQCSYKGRTFPNPDEKSQTPPTQQQNSQLKTYQDTKNGFTFQYSPQIFTESRVNEKLPWKNKSIDSLLLVHTVPTKHCDLSGLPGHCTDTTTDISIAFTPLEASLADVIASAKGDMGGSFTDISFGSTQAKTATLGVEGEGNVYYFVSLAPEKSLMITRSFINEQVLSGYQNAPQFITFMQQEKTLESLMATFTLNK